MKVTMNSIVIRIFLLQFGLLQAKITIEVKAGQYRNDTKISYTGSDVTIVNDDDLKLFKINKDSLGDAIKKHYGKKATHFYLKSPTPWNDLYKTYNWEQVTKVLTIQSARIKNISLKPVQILTHDFDNISNKTIKVNTGISQTVSNTITTTWSKEEAKEISQEIDYDINVIFAKLAGTTGFSYTTTWGKSEEKSESITIGSTSNVETELKPNQAVTATLTAKRGILEIEIVYLATLKGNVAINFKKKYKDHHFWGPRIERIMKDGEFNNNVRVTEIIKLDIHMDSSLTVYDKQTGLPL